ncbi:Uncharacterized conserved protein, DUF2147 family [Sulfitobacter marinus]|uniref:Uncharacterized conserved protein, DUF2147 family n=1 Tax=Sulfitobacter marinus TaxID=394264 RepID=A0A1I6RWB3_9RHOB|nr:DUF2147 domain-containing protein [Sulfitobacter marinus]SFS69001.1 Uncharacterized conserved protein, DUF2147 family [Sulfitobacter marinus]
MKRVILAAVLGVMAAGAAMAEDPAVGVWKTQPDDGSYAHVKMTPCGAEICGTMMRTFNDDGEYTSPNLGKQLVIGMVPDGKGNYAGKVWRPSNDKIYIGKMTVTGDNLKLSGCIAGGLLCSKQNWSRLK